MTLALLVAALLIGGCQPSPEKLRADAEQAMARDDYAEASIHLKNLLLRNPDDAWARAALGTSALRLGDPDAAEKELRRALALGAPAENQVSLVQALLTNGKYQAALEEMKTLSAATPAEVLMLSGLAHRGLAGSQSARPEEAQKHFDDAEKNFRDAAIAAPAETAPLTSLAEMMLTEGRSGEADALIDKALALDPAAVDAVVMKGRRTLEVSGPQKAATYLASALARATSSAERVALLRILAGIQLGMGDVQAAEATAKELERLAPGQLETRLLRAKLLAKAGDYDRAIRMLQRMLSETERILDVTTGMGRNDILRLNLAIERALGEAQYLNSNLEQAAMHISRVIAAEGSDPALELLLLQIRRQQNGVKQSLLPMIRKGPGAAFEQGLVTFGDESALEYYRRSGATDSDNINNRLGEISARLASGDVDTARALLDGLRASQPDEQSSTQIDYLSVMIDIVQRDHPKAQAAARKLVSEHPREAWSHLLLATAYGAGDADADARREFEAVLRIEPRNKEAELNLARLDYKQGDPQSGDRRLLGMIENDPEDLRPRLQLVEAKLSANRFDEALDRAREMARVSPDDVQVLNLLGQVEGASGKWDDAKKSFERLTVLYPDDPRNWTNLARATVASGSRGDWPASMDKALALARARGANPGVLANTLASAGDVAMELRQPAKAVNFYGEAYGIAPNWQLAVRDCAARSSVDPGADCVLVRSWLERNPRDVGARLFLAVKFLRRGQVDSAIPQFEAVLDIDPRQATALNNLAYLYSEKGDDRALDIAKRALDAQPDSAPVMDTLGWIYLRRGDKSRGLELIERAAKILPGNPDIGYHLAYAQAENGQSEEARKTLGNTLRENTSFQSRSEAEQLMQRLGG